jgi:L-malate glycosyltransferase
VPRILYFSRDYTPHDWRFLAALADTQHQVHYLRFEGGENQYEDRPIPDRVETIAWEGGQGGTTFRDLPRLLPKLKQVINELAPDLIHAGPIQSVALPVALSGYQPLVSMSWGYDLLLDAERDPFMSWATRYTLKHSAIMVGDCQAIRERAISFGMPDSRIVIFPWGVTLAGFTPGESQLPHHRDSFTLLSMRNWDPIYGVEVIARAFVQVAAEQPQARLIMVGGGSQAETLRQIFTEGGVIDQVVFPGRLSQAELPGYYRQADLYLSASRVDGSSLSLLEAMACGCPVLVSDIPGNREWVDPGLNGWLFSDGDDQALARAILQVMEKSDLLQQAGKAARQVAEARADWRVNFQELLRAYELALSSSR